jgi:hypothetical protein
VGIRKRRLVFGSVREERWPGGGGSAFASE